MGIWLATNDDSMIDIIKVLEKEACGKLPLFIDWGQDQCQTCERARICHPNNSSAEAFLKPLAYASKIFGCDA